MGGTDWLLGAALRGLLAFGVLAGSLRFAEFLTTGPPNEAAPGAVPCGGGVELSQRPKVGRHVTVEAPRATQRVV